MDKRTKARQDKHVENLKLIVSEVKDYHQGLGYVAAFLGLLLDSEEVVKVALYLHRSTKYSAGYFMGAPQAFVADAKVMYKILEKQKPDLHKHLLSKAFFQRCLRVSGSLGCACMFCHLNACSSSTRISSLMAPNIYSSSRYGT